MTKNWKVVLAALAIAVGTAGLSDGASTAKKLSLAQAWKVCKAQVDKKFGPNTTDSNVKDRYYTGAACMKEHGFNL